MNILEKLSESGQWIYIVLAVAVIGLILLIACLRLLQRLARAVDAKADAGASRIEPAVAYPAVQAIEQGIDPRVIAAISAAVAAMSESGKTLVIRSVKKSAGWQKAARAEQVSRF